MTAVDLSLTETTLAKYPPEPQHLISVLQDLQLGYRYLPREALGVVAERLHVPLAKVYGVATFYKAFSLVPRGEKVLRVCTGTACHIRGAPLILGELKTRLGISPGGTTADQKFSLEAVNCVGACALAPGVMVNDSAHGNVTVTKARRLVQLDGGATPIPTPSLAPAPAPAPAPTPATPPAVDARPEVRRAVAARPKPRVKPKVKGGARTKRPATRVKPRGKK